MFDQLKKELSDENCPNYWLPNINLFEQKYSTKVTQGIINLIDRIVGETYAIDGWLECSRCLMLNCCFFPHCCDKIEDDSFDDKDYDLLAERKFDLLDENSNSESFFDPIVCDYNDDCCWSCEKWKKEFDVY